MTEQRKDRGLKSGQYTITHYRGTGGDLIVGRITSVRVNGIINGVNMLTGKPFAKQAKILLKRNTLCFKKHADLVVAEYSKETTAKAGRARARALAIRQAHLLQGRVPTASVAAKQGETVLRDFKKLPEDDKRKVLKALFKDLVNTFGIA